MASPEGFQELEETVDDGMFAGQNWQDNIVWTSAPWKNPGGEAWEHGEDALSVVTSPLQTPDLRDEYEWKHLDDLSLAAGNKVVRMLTGILDQQPLPGLELD